MKLTRQHLRRLISEEVKSTKKYDDDSALKGGQDDLPDNLQKAIIDKEVEEEEAEDAAKKNESKQQNLKVSSHRLRNLVKEELHRLLEMNPDGTISDDEDDERADLLAQVEIQIDELIQHVRDEAERIGGGFRSPGIRAEVFQLMAEKIHGAR
tara:strand:+ start:212 stop:670 length:459 start_codon:yes stop_codon:yes gene_type:complete